MSSRSASARLSAAVTQQQGDDVDVHVCKHRVGALGPGSDKQKPIPSYARPTSSSKRRASVASAGLGNLSFAEGSVTRPQSAEASARISSRPSKQFPLTAQLSYKTQSRRSVIAADSAPRLSTQHISRSSSLSQQSSDSNAASDQHLQQRKANQRPSRTDSGSRGSRSSLSDAQAHAGKRPTAASWGETTATSTSSRPTSQTQTGTVTAAKPLVKSGTSTASAATAAATRSGAKSAGSYAQLQHSRQTTPNLASAAKCSQKLQTAARAMQKTASHISGQARLTGQAVRTTPRQRHSSSSAYMPFPTAIESEAAVAGVDVRTRSNSDTVRGAKRQIRSSTAPEAAVNTTAAIRGPLRHSTSGQPVTARTPTGTSAQAAGTAPADRLTSTATATGTTAATARPYASVSSSIPRTLPAAVAANAKASSHTSRSTSKAAANGASNQGYASSSNRKPSATSRALLQSDATETPVNGRGGGGSAVVAAAAAEAAAVGETPDGPSCRFTMLVTPGGPQWPAAALVPYSITPETKTAARISNETHMQQQQQQQQQEQCGLVPYSVTPISRTAAKASVMESEQEQEVAAADAANEIGSAARIGIRTGSRSQSSGRSKLASSPKAAAQGYVAAAAAAKRRAAGKSPATGGTACATPRQKSPTPVSAGRTVSAVISCAAPVLVATAPVVPLEILSSGMSGLSIGDAELGTPGVDVNQKQLAAAEGAVRVENDGSPSRSLGIDIGYLANDALLEAELAVSPTSTSSTDVSLTAAEQLAAADEETAAAAAISAAHAAAAEARAAAEALEKELAVEAARLAAEAAAQVEQQQLAREAAAAAATLAAAVAASAVRVPANPSDCAAAAAAAAGGGSSVGGSSSAYPKRPMRTPEGSPLRSRTPARSPLSAAQHAELAAKMQDLELSWGSYKVTRDASPNVRSSIRSSMVLQQQQQQCDQPGSSSNLSSDACGISSTPSKFWDISPPSAATSARYGKLGATFNHPTASASNTTSAATTTTPPAAANSKSAAGDDSAAAASAAKAAGLELQLQELRDIWGKYNSSREESPRGNKTPHNRSSWANSAEKTTLTDTTAAAAAAAAEEVVEEEEAEVQHNQCVDGNMISDAAAAAAAAAAQLSVAGIRQQKMTPASVSSKQVQTGSNIGRVTAAAAGVKRQLESGSSGDGRSAVTTSGSRRTSATRGTRRCSVTRSAAPLNATAATCPRTAATTTGSSSRRRSKGSTVSRTIDHDGALAVGSVTAAVIARSPVPKAAAAAAAAAVPAAAGASDGGWNAAAVWCAPSPDPCSPQRTIQQQQQHMLEESLTCAVSPAAARATAATGNGSARDATCSVDNPRSVIASSKVASKSRSRNNNPVSSSAAAAAAIHAAAPVNPNASPFSLNKGAAAAAAAVINSPAAAASPTLAVPPNSPAVTPGTDIDEVAVRLAAWSVAKDNTLNSSNAAAASSPGAVITAAAAAGKGGATYSKLATAAKSVTTAAGSATLCWMLRSGSSPGTVEGKPKPPTAAAGEGDEADPMQASWLAFTAAAAAAPVEDEAAGAVTAPRFRLSGIGAASGTHGVSAADDAPRSPSVTFNAQPAAAAAAAGIVDGSSGKRYKSVRGTARCTAAQVAASAASVMSPACGTPQRQQQHTAAADVLVSPAATDVFYTPMQFTPGSNTSQKKLRSNSRSNSSTRKTTGRAGTAAAAAELFFTPADGFTPGCKTAAGATGSIAAAAEIVESPAVTSSTKRQKSNQHAAAGSSAAAAPEVQVSRQLLGLFEAAGGDDEDVGAAAAAAEALSRKYSALQGQQDQQTSPVAAVWTSTAAAATAAVRDDSTPMVNAIQQQCGNDNLSSSSNTAASTISQTPATTTPVSYRDPTNTAAAAVSSTESPAAYLAAITPLMRSIGGFGSLSSRKLPHIGSGARRVRLAAAQQGEIPTAGAAAAEQGGLHAAAAAAADGEAVRQSAVRRSARLATKAAATPTGHQSAAEAAASTALSGDNVAVSAFNRHSEHTAPVAFAEIEVMNDMSHLQELQATAADTIAAADAGFGANMADNSNEGVDDAAEAADESTEAADESMWEADDDHVGVGSDEFLSGADFAAGGFDQPAGEELAAEDVRLMIDESYVTTRRRH